MVLSRTVLVLPPKLRAELEEIVRGGYPLETCGVLVGEQREGGAVVTGVVSARNIDTEHPADRYEVDPGDFMAADLAARAVGRELVAIWHSHPDHPARPSETDRAAAWSGWSYVIASVGAAGIGTLRSWRLTDEAHFVEEPLLDQDAALPAVRGDPR